MGNYCWNTPQTQQYISPQQHRYKTYIFQQIDRRRQQKRLIQSLNTATIGNNPENNGPLETQRDKSYNNNKDSEMHTNSLSPSPSNSAIKEPSNKLKKTGNLNSGLSSKNYQNSEMISQINSKKVMEYENQLKNPKNNAYSIAYYSHRLIQNAAIKQKNNADIQTYYKTAYQFYHQHQTSYFEQIINLNTTMALYYQTSRNYEYVIQLLKEAIQLLDKYCSIDDQRHVLAWNNLACSYYQSNNADKGEEYIGKCRQMIQKYEETGLKKDQKIIQLKQLVENNHSYYKQREDQSRRQLSLENQQKK